MNVTNSAGTTALHDCHIGRTEIKTPRDYWEMMGRVATRLTPIRDFVHLIMVADFFILVKQVDNKSDRDMLTNSQELANGRLLQTRTSGIEEVRCDDMVLPAGNLLSMFQRDFHQS